MASFPDWSSILPIFCPFCSPSRCFCHLSPVQRPVLHDFRSSEQNELFNNLVAQFVGTTGSRAQCQLAEHAGQEDRLSGRVGEEETPNPATWWPGFFRL